MVDVNKPVTNPELCNAIKIMQETKTVDSKNKMVDAVIKAHFLSPVAIDLTPNDSENGVITLTEDTSISFNMLTDSNGKTFYPVFTDWNALKEWQKKEAQQTIVTTFADLSSIVLKNKQCDGFAINPNSDNVIFDSVFIQHITNVLERKKSDEMVEITIEKETKVILAQPKDYPQEMVDAISEKLKKISCVNAAYLFLMIKPDNDEQSYLVAVDYNGDKQEVYDSIGKTSLPFLKNMYLYVVPATDGFVVNSVKNSKPFYKKKLFGIF